MKIHRTLLVFTFLTASLAFANGKQLWSPLEPINELGIGTFSGKLQSLTHYRDFGRYLEPRDEGDASTLAITLQYKSREYHGFSVGAQYVHSFSFWKDNPDRMHNGPFHILNHAYLNWNFKEFGLEKTDLKIGRFHPDFLLSSYLAPRQKEQGLEGIMLRTKDLENYQISLGWIRKFSSWSSRHKNTPGDFFLNYEYTDVADLAGRPYKTSGTYFADVVYTGIKGVKLNVGDWFSENVMNTYYGSLTLEIVENFASWNILWAHQDSVGKWEKPNVYSSGTAPRELNSNYLQTSLTFKPCKRLSITPGFAIVPGSADDDEDHRFYDIFQAHLTPLMGLIGSPYGYLAGSKIATLTAVYKPTPKLLLYAYFANTHVDSASPYDGHEINGIVSYGFNEQFSVAAKGGYGWFDGSTQRGDSRAKDARLFITYKF